MRKRAVLGLLAGMTVASVGGVALGDVVPPNQMVCEGHVPGDPCITSTGVAGGCGNNTLQVDGGTLGVLWCWPYTDAGTGLGDAGMDGGTNSSGGGCSVAPAHGLSGRGGYAFGALALGIVLARRRSRRPSA